MFPVSFSFLKSEVTDISFGEKLQICSRLLKSFLYSKWEAAFQKFLVFGNPFSFFSSNHTLEKVLSMKNNLKMKYILAYISLYAKCLISPSSLIGWMKKNQLFFHAVLSVLLNIEKVKKQNNIKKSQLVSKPRHLRLEKIPCHELMKLN